MGQKHALRKIRKEIPRELGNVVPEDRKNKVDKLSNEGASEERTRKDQSFWNGRIFRSNYLLHAVMEERTVGIVRRKIQLVHDLKQARILGAETENRQLEELENKICTSSYKA